MSLVTKVGQTISSTGGTNVTFDLQSQVGNVREFEVSSDTLLTKRKLRSKVSVPKITNGRPGGYSKASNEFTFITPFTCADGSKDENFVRIAVNRNVETSDAQVNDMINQAIEGLIAASGTLRVAVVDNTQIA